MARSQVSKKLRFDVLERDGFRCRYCGAEPDDGALHVDHIIPVAEGGSTAIDNLITSCEPCNSGKGRWIIGDAQPLPDMAGLADVKLAEVKTINRWRKAYKKANETVHEAALLIREEHNLGMAIGTIERAIREYGVAEVDSAASVTAGRVDRSAYEAQTKYMYAVLRNRRADEAAPAKEPEYIRPAKVYEDDCLFGFGSCGLHYEDGRTGIKDGCCVRLDDGAFTACATLVKHLGGWTSCHALDVMILGQTALAWRADKTSIIGSIIEGDIAE